MKTLFYTIIETIFSMLTIALIIACLPTIMGIVALCFIIYFVYKAANGLFS